VCSSDLLKAGGRLDISNNDSRTPMDNLWGLLPETAEAILKEIRGTQDAFRADEDYKPRLKIPATYLLHGAKLEFASHILDMAVHINASVYYVLNGHASRVSSLADLVGRVKISHKDQALAYARLLTSPLSFHW